MAFNKVRLISTNKNILISVYYYVIKFVSDLRQIGGFVRVSRFPPPIKWPQRYNWNIVESGVKHHDTKPNQQKHEEGNVIKHVT